MVNQYIMIRLPGNWSLYIYRLGGGVLSGVRTVEKRNGTTRVCPPKQNWIFRGEGRLSFGKTYGFWRNLLHTIATKV